MAGRKKPREHLSALTLALRGAADRTSARSGASTVVRIRTWDRLPARFKAAIRDDIASIAARPNAADVQAAGYSLRVARLALRDLGIA